MQVSIKLQYIVGNQGLIQSMTYRRVHIFFRQNLIELFWQFNYILILNTNASIYITKMKKKKKEKKKSQHYSRKKYDFIYIEARTNS